MKKIFAIVLVVVLMATLIPGVALADKPDTKGNGLPKDQGKSFNFNVIAVPKQKHWEENSFDTGGNGKRIFILRTGTTWFYVSGGSEFAINDHDGTDGKVGTGGTPGSGNGTENAGIILPYNATTEKWDCTVYVRLLGPANKTVDFRWKTYCWNSTYWAQIDEFGAQIDEFVLDRNTKFAPPVGKILADGYEDILWEWDNKHNLRICQFRIFVGAPDGGYPP